MDMILPISNFFNDFTETNFYIYKWLTYQDHHIPASCLSWQPWCSHNTNKITKEECMGVLINDVHPDADFTASRFCELATRAVDSIADWGLLSNPSHSWRSLFLHWRACWRGKWRKQDRTKCTDPLPEASIWCHLLSAVSPYHCISREVFLSNQSSKFPFQTSVKYQLSGSVLPCIPLHYKYCVECCEAWYACQCMCTKNTRTHISHSALPREAWCWGVLCAGLLWHITNHVHHACSCELKLFAPPSPFLFSSIITNVHAHTCTLKKNKAKCVDVFLTNRNN
jgi:hypothetical protein